MKYSFFVISIMVGLYSCTYDKGPLQSDKMNDCNGKVITYESDVKAILTTYCNLTENGNGCHASGGAGNGNYTTYSGIKGKVDNGSFLVRVLQQRDMPPSYSPGATSLPDSVISKLQCWISNGALEK